MVLAYISSKFLYLSAQAVYQPLSSPWLIWEKTRPSICPTKPHAAINKQHNIEDFHMCCRYGDLISQIWVT